jgi:hypothetical protein
MSTKDYKTLLVPIDEIDQVWDKVKDLIKKTSDEILNENDIYQYLIDGTYRLWLIIDNSNNKFVSAGTTCIMIHPNHIACRIVTLGGTKLEDYYQSSLKYVENWAKQEGCDFMEVFGRRGWAKILKDYKEECVLLRKHLIN